MAIICNVRKTVGEFWYGLNIWVYLLLLCIGTKCISSFASRHNSSALSCSEKNCKFLFFCSNIKTWNFAWIELNGRYFWLVQKCEQFEEKRNVPFLLYLYITQYLLKYVIMLNQILLLKVFWTKTSEGFVRIVDLWVNDVLCVFLELHLLQEKHSLPTMTWMHLRLTCFQLLN